MNVWFLLQILVMSATMDVDHFSAYFNAAPVLYLEGRQYPVQVKVNIYIYLCFVSMYPVTFLCYSQYKSCHPMDLFNSM